MSHYTVVWDDELERQFLAAWLSGSSQTRRALTEIANWIDSTLGMDPGAKGRVLPESLVRLIDVPVSNSAAVVSAVYEILPVDKQVRVLRLIFRLE